MSNEDQDTAKELYSQGLDFEQKGMSEEALEAYRKVIALVGGHKGAVAGWRRVQKVLEPAKPIPERENELTDMIRRGRKTIFERTRKAIPSRKRDDKQDKVKELYSLGIQFEIEGKLEDALQKYEEVLVLDPNHMGASDRRLVVSKALAPKEVKLVNGEDALTNGPTDIIEKMSDKEIEENLASLVDFFVESVWGDWEEGPFVPDSVKAASRAIEKKAHLIPKDQRERMEKSAFAWFDRTYSARSVRVVNEIVLRTQGPDAVDFAKRAAISHFNWENCPGDHFIDTRMIDFLRSKGIDPIPVLVDRAMQILHSEWPGLRYMKLVANFDAKAADMIRSELINTDLTNLYWGNLRDVQIVDFFKEISDLLGEWAPYAFLGDFLQKLVDFEDLTTRDPASYNWKSDDSYSRELRDVVHILTPKFPFEQERFVKDLILALDYDHEKTRTGAAFLVWAYEVKDTRIKSRLEKLAKKYRDDPLLAITLKILNR